MAAPLDLRIGCCGFPMARQDYFERFHVVEIQQTFYQPPRLSTLQRWREEAPPTFEFSLKAWQLITHGATSPTYRRLKMHLPKEKRDRYGNFRPTDEVFAAWETTLASARALQAKVVIFQCPASFTPTEPHIANMRTFFKTIGPDTAGLTLGWEPRGVWPREITQQLCRELGLVPVVDPFHETPPEGGLRYFRLHGMGNYGYRYSDEELGRLLALCQGTTYCLFNNVNMAEDAARFSAMALAAVP
jgi:uncharacterized protein YecE (DUF72 family)